MADPFYRKSYYPIEPLDSSLVNGCILWTVTRQHDDLEAVAALAEATRRSLYDYVVGADHPVGREEAARATRVAVHTAKFHLDKLVDAGLLTVEFHKLTGRTGPGSGRPSKLYRRATAEVTVALPARHYDLLSEVLVDAVAASLATDEGAEPAAHRLARERGRHLGEDLAAGRSDSGSADLAAKQRLCEALIEGGYEPCEDDRGIWMRNCPFHRAAQRQTALVCGINLEYVRGIIDGLDYDADARLDPGPGRCCVRVAEGEPR